MREFSPFGMGLAIYCTNLNITRSIFQRRVTAVVRARLILIGDVRAALPVRWFQILRKAGSAGFTVAQSSVRNRGPG